MFDLVGEVDWFWHSLFHILPKANNNPTNFTTMVLNGKGDLAIAQLAFFAPAFCVALFVFVRHGFFKQMGWFYLVTLSILRIVGASALLYAETKNDYSESLIETYAICSAVGTAPLLLSLLGSLERVSDGMKARRKEFPLPIFLAIHLAAILGLVLAIVGGVEEPTSAQAIAGGHSTGQKLIEAASVIFLVIFLSLAFITIFFFASRKDFIVYGEMKLVYAGLAALPFLTVRIIYTILVAFDVNKNFFYRDTNIYVTAFMQFMMEAIVVIIFIATGLMVPRLAKQPMATRNDVEGMGNMQSQGHAEKKNIGDYRPSKMIGNAMRGR